MHISVLNLTNYRNFDQVQFSFDSEKTAICADNAYGKSNLLEAIYFLALAKSGRGSKDRDVLRWGSEFFVIEATAERDHEPLSIRIAYDSRIGKKAFLDENPLTRLSDLVGTFNAVLFSPEDVDLVLREPSQRRRILDILVSQSSASYLADLELYQRVLSQRNKLLKNQGSRLLPAAKELQPWDLQLAELGGRIIERRISSLEELQPKIGQFYSQIATTPEQLKAVYKSQVSDFSQSRELLAELLAQRLEKEIQLGYTLSGPHRDNLVFTLDDKEAHVFGSKGQMKSVLLAWKLAEAVFLEIRTGSQPVLLMDDIFSELDSLRARALLEIIPTFGQVVLTSARDPDLDFQKRGFKLLNL